MSFYSFCILLFVPFLIQGNLFYTDHAKDLILEFVEFKRIHQIIILPCHDNNIFEFVQLIRSLSNHGTSAALIHSHPGNNDSARCLEFGTHLVGFLIDAECTNNLHRFIKVLGWQCLDLAHPWLVFCSWNCPWLKLEQRQMRRFIRFGIRLDSDIILAQPLLSASGYQISELYQTNGHLLQNNLGIWKKENPNLESLLPKQFVFSKQRRGDLSEETIRITLAPIFPRIKLTDVTTKTNFLAQDINHSVFLILREYYNFRLEAMISREFTGVFEGNDSQIGMIETGQADLAVSISTIIPPLLDKVDPVHAVINIKPMVIFSQPTTKSFNIGRNILFSPFTWSTWTLFFVCVLCVAIIYHICLYTAVKIKNLPKHMVDNDSRVAAIILQQSNPTLPKGLPVRIVIIFTLITIQITYLFYTGQMTSIMSDSDYSISSLKELVAHKYQINIDVFQILRYYIENSSNPDIRQFRRNFKISQNVMAVDDGIRLILSSSSTCYLTSIMLLRNFVEKQLTREEACRLSLINIRDLESLLGMNVARGSPLREIMDHVTLKVVETGVLDFWLRKLEFINNKQCDNEKQFKSIDLKDMIPIFHIIIIGIGVSVIVFCLELIRDCLSKIFTSVKKNDFPFYF